MNSPRSHKSPGTPYSQTSFRRVRGLHVFILRLFVHSSSFFYSNITFSLKQTCFKTLIPFFSAERLMGFSLFVTDVLCVVHVAQHTLCNTCLS